MTDEVKAEVEYSFAHSFNHTLHAYIDITEDLVAGTLLSQILYWFMPDKDGKRKVRVYKHNHYWLAKGREDWWDEIRITPKQYDRAIKILKEKELVESQVFRFSGLTYCHIRPIMENILAAIEKWKIGEAAKIENATDFPKGKKRISPKGESGIDERVIPLTEITTEFTDKDYNNHIKGVQGDNTVKRYYPPNNSIDYDILDRQIGSACKSAEIENAVDIDNIKFIVKYYFKSFYSTFGHEHTRLNQKVMVDVVSNIKWSPSDMVDGTDRDMYMALIDQHFQTQYKNCDYSIVHFLTEGILTNRFYETCY